MLFQLRPAGPGGVAAGEGRGGGLCPPVGRSGCDPGVKEGWIPDSPGKGERSAHLRDVNLSPGEWETIGGLYTDECVI